MKILLDKYPKGTYKGQRTDGRYIDGYLYENLKECAKVITNDMTFMSVVFSSTLEVGTGKSVFVSQCGEAWTHLMKEIHGIELPFNARNCVFRPRELIDRAFEVPRYSFLWLDEWEDATYWSELGMSLRRFFRKCRQLNLFIMVIIPNWFQLPLSYAVSRSVFAVDVRFESGFQRGFFNFYGFKNKRDLYIRGRRDHNYYAAKSDFTGRFLDGYGIPEADYRRAKLKDLQKQEEDKNKPTKAQELEIRNELIKKIYASKKLTQEQLATALGLSQNRVSDIINDRYDKENKESGVSVSVIGSYNNNLVDKEIIWDEEAVLKDADN